MNILVQLQTILSELSRNERRIAEYILQHPQSVKNFSSEALAAACEASRSTIIRLCQKMGYQGYSEFKNALILEQTTASDESSTWSTTAPLLPTTTDNALHYYCYGLLQMEPLINSSIVSEIVNTLSYANRVVALGYGHSGFSAQQLSFRLNKFGIDCHTLQDSTLMASYERILQQGDVVVIFSISARNDYEAFVTEYCKNRVKVILITMTPDCELSRFTDITVALPHLSNVSGLYPMDDAITFYMFIEMIMEALNQKLNKLNWR